MKNIRRAMVVLAALPLLCSSEVIRLYATSETTLTITGKPNSVVLSKAAGEASDWQKHPYTMEGDKIKLEVVPPASGKEMLILIDPDKNWNIDDRQAPALKSIKINGTPMQLDKGMINLPEDIVVDTITWKVEDDANALNAKLCIFTLDDSPLPFSLDGKAAEGSLHLDPKVVGSHIVRIRMIDQAPEANTLEIAIPFKYAEQNSLLHAQKGLDKITVDSSFEGYTSLAPLTDGVLRLPGNSAGGDVTWASAESGTDHWVRMDFKKEVSVSEGYIFWPRLENSSTRVELQVLKGEKWETLASTPAGGQKPTMMTLLKAKQATKGRSFRFWQPKEGGPAGRPDIFWICEIILK